MLPMDALSVMWEALRFAGRIRGWYHLALGNLTLSKNCHGVVAIDPRAAAACQLCRAKRGDHDELERVLSQPLPDPAPEPAMTD